MKRRKKKNIEEKSEITPITKDIKNEMKMCV